MAKERLWTATRMEFAVSVAGVAGTIFNPNLGLAFRAKTGRNFLRSDTVTHTWVKGVWTQSAAGDSSRETLHFGIGFFTPAIDAVDMPNLFDRDGDLLLHDGRGFREPTVLQTPMVPQQLATIDIESKGQRSVPATTTELLFFAQCQEAPSAGSFELQVAVTQLWLIAN